MDNLMYFDNAATTFPKPEIVYREMDRINRNLAVNAGRGSYSLSRDAAKIIDETRDFLAELVGLSRADRVIFTPSATIALNQIILGLEWDEFKNVYVTPFEHNAIMRPLNYIKKKHGIKIHTIPFKKDSFELDFDRMKMDFSRNHPDYIFMSHVSNVTGYVLPCKTVIEEAKKYEAVTTLDCSQSMGLVPFDVNDIGADFFVFAGHKTLYGPFGIGGYVDSSKVKLKEIITGGTGSDSLNLDMPEELPGRFEAASHNILAIGGLNAALRWIKETDIKVLLEKEQELTRLLVDGLKDIEGVKLYVPENPESHVGIVSFNLEGYRAEDLAMILDEDYNVAVRAGYHCAPLVHEFLDSEEFGGTVRCSLGWFNGAGDVERFLSKITDI